LLFKHQRDRIRSVGRMSRACSACSSSKSWRRCVRFHGFEI